MRDIRIVLAENGFSVEFCLNPNDDWECTAEVFVNNDVDAMLARIKSKIPEIRRLQEADRKRDESAQDFDSAYKEASKED